LPENTEEQLKQLQSQNPKEHRVTNGCIRLVMGDLEYVTTVFREGSMVYILPDNEGETGEKKMVLDPKTLYIWDAASKNFLNSEGKRLLTHVQKYDKVVKM